MATIYQWRDIWYFNLDIQLAFFLKNKQLTYKGAAYIFSCTRLKYTFLYLIKLDMKAQIFGRSNPIRIGYVQIN